MSDVKISALPVGMATSSTPFPAIVGGVTDQVTLAPLYTVISTIQTDVSGKAALVHTHVESDVTSLVADLALKSSVGHTHPESDITSLVADLALKSSTGHTHASTDLVSGTIATARLGSGSATSTTYLRGDQTYADVGSITAGTFFPNVALIPLVQSSWGWINQSGASVTQGATTVFFDSTASATGLHCRTIAAPTTPYTITVMLRGWYYNVGINTQYAGVMFRDLGGKIIPFYVTSANQFQVVKFSSPTVFVTSTMVISLAAAGDYHWLRIADDGTTIKFSNSLDGVNFNLAFSEPRGTFFSSAPGPQEVGIFVANDSGTQRVSASYFSWITS